MQTSTRNRFSPRLACGLLLGLVALATASSAGHASDSSANVDSRFPMTVLEERPGAGEQCIVCDSEVHDATIVEMRYKGRVFHVRSDMEADFRSHPEEYFRKMEAHGSLFDESAVTEMSHESQRPEANRGWLYFGLYALIGVVFGALCSTLAVSRAIPALPWFFFGLFGNVLALGILVFTRSGDVSNLPAGIPDGLGKVPQTRSPISCPKCGSQIHPAAASCSACGVPLNPSVEAETARA